VFGLSTVGTWLWWGSYVKTYINIVRTGRTRSLDLIAGIGRDILFSVSRPPNGAHPAVCLVVSEHLAFL
jgi:hypothetical protein